MDLIRSGLARAFSKTLLASGYTVVFFVIVTARGAAPNQVPDDTLAALETGDHFELLSLNPKWNQTNTDFHGYRVLGKTTVTNAQTRSDLIGALKKAAEENKGVVARCFNPRHGIRVKFKGQTIDLVICFQCLQISVHEKDKNQVTFLTTRYPQSLFNKVLSGAGVPLAPKE